MSENLHELCSTLIEEFYGDFYAQLYSQLTYHGRLSAPQIAQRSHLPLKQVKCGLASLVQRRLIYHHTTSEGLSTYQANTRSAYDLLRTGKIIELVRNLHGDLASIVVTESLTLGFASIAELERVTLDVLRNAHGEQIEAQQAAKVAEVVESLIDEGYLEYVRSAHLQNPFDAKHDVELHLKTQGYSAGVKGKKAQLEMETRANIELERRTSTNTPEYGFTYDGSSSKKRSIHDENGESNIKRRKVNGESSAKMNGVSESSRSNSSSRSATLLYVSFNNLSSYTRNAYLAAQAKKSLNMVHSKVLLSALSQIHGTRQYESGVRDNVLDVRQIQEDLNRPTKRPLTNGHLPNGVAKVNGTHAIDNSYLDEEGMSYNEVDRALAVLADSEFLFLNGAYGKDWTVTKHAMDRFVLQHEVARIMGDRLHPPALRIVRMLSDKGKLDEKALQEVGLLSAKDLRQTLAELKQMGFIDLQEVPRESQRQPNRTIYLWFHDVDRVRKVLLETLYKAMTRLLERLKLERRKLSSTLEKIERSDVQGNEEQTMSTAELNVLRRWRRLESWTLGEVSRLDESVSLLRDL